MPVLAYAETQVFWNQFFCSFWFLCALPFLGSGPFSWSCLQVQSSVWMDWACPGALWFFGITRSGIRMHNCVLLHIWTQAPVQIGGFLIWLKKCLKIAWAESLPVHLTISSANCTVRNHKLIKLVIFCSHLSPSEVGFWQFGW